MVVTTLTAILFILVPRVLAIWFTVAEFIHTDALAAVTGEFSFSAFCWRENKHWKLVLVCAWWVGKYTRYLEESHSTSRVVYMRVLYVYTQINLEFAKVGFCLVISNTHSKEIKHLFQKWRIQDGRLKCSVRMWLGP